MTMVFWLCAAYPSLAHESDDHAATGMWTFDPWIIAPLTITAGLYGLGSQKLWRRTTYARGEMLLRLAFAILGLSTLATALISPLHWLGEHLFTFHMIEHEIVMAVSAPLIVLARPVSAFIWALPRKVRHLVGDMMNSLVVRKLRGWLTRGVNATVLHGTVIWAWHVPWLFDASVTNTATHRLQHLSFFLTALLFWWSMLWRCDRGIAAWHLFVTMVHTSILGALLALAPRVLYKAQTADAMEWGLTPLEDQQLAGMLMWVPAGTIYAGAALTIFFLWIRSSSARGVRNV